MSPRHQRLMASEAWTLGGNPLAAVLCGVGVDAVLMGLFSRDVHTVFLVSRGWARAALAHRARRIWAAPRTSWQPFARFFRPGASAQEVIATEEKVGRLPFGIRSIMQECQGAGLPVLGKSPTTEFGVYPGENPMMYLLPLASWFLLSQGEQERCHTAVRRIVIGLDGLPTTVLRTDTWEVEILEGSTQWQPQRMCTFAEWISRDMRGICCAGQYVESLKDIAGVSFGLDLQARFAGPGPMIAELVARILPQQQGNPREWRQQCGSQWQYAVLEALRQSPIPWHFLKQLVRRSDEIMICHIQGTRISGTSEWLGPLGLQAPWVTLVTEVSEGRRNVWDLWQELYTVSCSDACQRARGCSDAGDHRARHCVQCLRQLLEL